MILSVENLSYSYGERTLFQNISFNVEDGDRYGIIGINGTGKTTLLRMLAQGEAGMGKIVLSSGSVIEYLPQEPTYNPELTVLEQIFQGNSPLMKLLRYYESAVEAATVSPDDDRVRRKLFDAQQQMDAQYAWQLESEAKAVLQQLGITDMRKKMGALSGGQIKRVALAGVLVRPSALLILDEPTNHMDTATVAWLEQMLLKRRGALLMVTHDRSFFDKVVNKTLELDGGNGYLYTGNYSLFLQKRDERRLAEAAFEKKLRNIYRRELAWISRGAEARRTKKKDRVERFAALEKEVKSVKDNLELKISSASSRLGKTVIEFDNVYFGYEGNECIRDFSYTLLRHDRIGVVGPNGAGKTTLMDIVAGNLQPIKGNIVRGKTVKIGYFSQHNNFPDSDMKVLEYIREVNNYVETADGERISAVQMLERFLFPQELQWVPVNKLSGGEKRRLFLLRVLMGAPNVLLLDEPTNDLDIPTLSVLEEYLDNFNGAVIAVSHDRYFLDRFAQKIFYIKDGEVHQYSGAYSEYIEQVWMSRLEERSGDKRVTENENLLKDNKKITYSERIELERIGQEIARSEAELKMLECEINSCGGDFVKLDELTRKQKSVQKTLEEMIDRWAYLEELAEE